MSQSQESDYALLSEVVNKTTSAIIVVSETGVIVKANQSALTLLGEETLQGRRWVEVISKVFRPRNDDGHEISTRDGKRLQVTTASLSSGQLIQMNDLSETRLLQDKLSHMERLSSLGRMAASLAHQIRTPLSAAMLYAANLGNANLQPMARKRFQEKLVSRLEALEAQVSDILMFARSNEQTVAQIDASQLVDQACNNVTAVLTKGGAQMATQIDEGPMTIMGNATALTGALSNLIANAVEAGAKRIILKLTRTQEAVVFSVANDGPRIPDELKEKIFEPFYTSKSSGTGLGLAVVSAVTKVHQGVLSLDEWNETFATVFNIAIPLFEQEQNRAQPTAASEHHEGTGQDSAYAHNQANFQTEHASSGTQAEQAQAQVHTHAQATPDSNMLEQEHEQGQGQEQDYSQEAYEPSGYKGALSENQDEAQDNLDAQDGVAQSSSDERAQDDAQEQELEQAGERDESRGAQDDLLSINEQQVAILRGAHKAGLNDLNHKVDVHSHIIGIGTIQGPNSTRERGHNMSGYERGNGELNSIADDIAMQQQAAAIFNQNHAANEHIIERSSLLSEDVHGQNGASFAHLQSKVGLNDSLSTPSFGSLPPTADGISKQAANEANNATSQAFAAYARKHQQQVAALKAAKEQQNAGNLNDGFTHVEIDVQHNHRIN